MSVPPRSGGSGASSGVGRGRGTKPTGNSPGGKGLSGSSIGSPSVGKGAYVDAFHAEYEKAPTVTPTSPATASLIPPYLSFIFRIEALHPNYEKQNRRLTSTGAWAPPTIKDAYTTTSSTFWRWQGGRVISIAANDTTLRSTLQRTHVASLFSQDPDTPHLLVVPFDVRTRNVRDYGRGWLPITFDHI